MERTLLLVDDEENILRSLVRVLRRDGYTILTADGGRQALELLEQHPVGVIVSDQRMPVMTGSEFLERAKEMRPDTIRIMLSGYTDLQSVTDAINRGSIYKFLTKPWDDELLRENISKAFEHYDLRAERDHLADQLTEANKQLADANVRLERQVANQDVALELHHRMLELSQDVLEHLPVGVIGIGDDGLIALANELAHRLLHQPLGALLSRVAADVLPAEIQHLCTTPVTETTITLPAVHIVPGGTPVQVHCSRLGEGMRNSGTMLVLVPEEG